MIKFSMCELSRMLQYIAAPRSSGIKSNISPPALYLNLY